ncbi:MAG: tail fiber domain-containing protein, partial [Chlorobi bacterium]|nr:tail fiber domain-containing protein [Chlorobiota bacterium]
DIADGAVTDAKISGVSWTKVTGAPTSFPPSGTAGGDLTGSYPNPTIATGAVTSAKILDGTITDADISSSASIAVSKLAPSSTDNYVLATVSGAAQWTDLSTLVPSVETDPQVGTLSNGQVAFWNGSALTGNNNLFWDNTNSRLGIGTNTPSSALHINDGSMLLTTSTATDGFAIEYDSSDVQLRQNENAEIQFRTNAAGGSDTVRMRLTSNGCLRFFGSGGQFRIELPFNGNNDVGRIRATGYSSWSTQRVKTNVRPLDGALDMVLRMRGVRYDWKPEYGGRADIGFIVEEVAPVLPEVVDRNPVTGEYESMDYTRVVAVLVEALKEEHKRNEDLRTQLAELRQMVEQLAAGRQVIGSTSNITVRVDGDWLGQNVPNPHDGTTTIPYYVPSGVGRAQLTLSDATGRLVRTIELAAREMWGSVTLDMSLLSSGTYEYSLVFDGRVVATKQMQLVK